jgi:hypothetical protein
VGAQSFGRKPFDRQAFWKETCPFNNSRVENVALQILVSVLPILPMAGSSHILYSYTITNNHRLLIYTSMEHSLLSLEHLALAFNFLDTLSDVRIVRIKAFMLLF